MNAQQKSYRPISRTEPFTVDGDEGVVQTVPFDMFDFPTLDEDHEELAKNVALFIKTDPEAKAKMVACGFHPDEIETLDMLGNGEITPPESQAGIIHALEIRWNSVKRSKADQS